MPFHLTLLPLLSFTPINEINSDYKFFPDIKREPKLMVNLSNKLINEKKQEKYYDLVPIYSRLPNITKKKEKR